MNDNLPPLDAIGDHSKKCKVCKEEILTGASRCRFCQCFQDWRRFVDFNVPALALVVSLVSIVSFLVPILRDMFVRKKSDIIVKFIEADDGFAYFLASNAGELPGSVGPAIFHYSNHDEPWRFRLNIQDFSGYVGPGQSTKIKISFARVRTGLVRSIFDERDELDRPIDDIKTGVTSERDGIVGMQIINFDGSSSEVTQSVSFQCREAKTDPYGNCWFSGEIDRYLLR